MNNFYVYSWKRPDTGDIFYIGKGTAYRDARLKRNNQIFMRIIAKLVRMGLEPTVKRIAENLTEGEAHDIERAEIARLGRLVNGTGKLANLTDGGEGASGYKHSAESAAKIGRALRGRKLGPLPTSVRIKMSAVSVGREKSASHANGIGNAQRLSPPRRDNSTGFKGVSIHAASGKYCANIHLDGKQVHLGLFLAAEVAARAYDEAAFAAWGANCYLNFQQLSAA